MVFWLAIIVGVISAFLAVKKSTFHAMWLILFNIAVSFYTGLMVAPAMLKMLPQDVDMFGYHTAACVFVMSILMFVVLHTITAAWLSFNIEISLPVVCEKIGLPLLGFLSGFIVYSFVLLLICMMPFMLKMREEGSSGSGLATKVATGPMLAVCNFISNASMQCYKDAPEAVLANLVDPQELPELQDEIIPSRRDILYAAENGADDIESGTQGAGRVASNSPISSENADTPAKPVIDKYSGRPTLSDSEPNLRW